MFACLNRVMDWIVKVSRSSSARSNIKQEGEGTSNYQISFEIRDYSSEIRKGRSYGIQHIAFILRKGGNSRRHCLASYIQDSKELFDEIGKEIREQTEKRESLNQKHKEFLSEEIWFGLLYQFLV